MCKNKTSYYMKLKIKTGLFAIAVAIGLGACSESYPGMYYETENPLINGETPDSSTLVPLYVYVNKQSFFSVSSVRNSGMRGIGAFNPITATKDKDGNPIQLTHKDSVLYYNTVFHIFSFRDGKYSSTGASYSGEIANEPNMTWTLMASSGGTKDESKMNCLVDGYDYNAGMPTYLDEKTGLFPTDKTPLYYGSYQDVGYNFFAYNIDDISTASCHRDRDSIYYDLEIDGTQDVMCGFAPRLTEEVLNERYSELTMTDSERQRVLNIGNYSTYAAHRNIDPYVDVYHEMSRLLFRAYPGDTTANYVTVDSIYVTCPASGKLVVAHKDPTRVGFYVNPDREKRLYLHENPELEEVTLEDGTIEERLKPCELIDSGYYHVEWKKGYANTTLNQREYVDIGGSIILPSRQEYVITIVATQNREGEIKRIVSTYRVAAPEKEENRDADGNYVFKTGRYYTINLVVYGLQPIKVFANIEGWQEGETIIVDPDDAETEQVYE